MATTSVSVPGIGASHNPGENLWQRALQTLDYEDMNKLRTNTNKLAVLDDILGQVETMKEDCLSKRWKYTNRSGKVVVIRDVLGKVICWIQKFKEIGDIAVQYDPSHAALPWSGIGFLLQITVNDCQTFGSMCEGIERISNMIPQYTVFELIYLRDDIPATSSIKDTLQASLVRLYAAILTYLSQAQRYYSQNTATRLVKSTFQNPEAMVDTYLDKISEEQANTDSHARLLDAECIHTIYQTVNLLDQSYSRILADIQQSERMIHESTIVSDVHDLRNVISELHQPIWRSATQLSELHDQLKQNERREILQWISNIPYKLHHKNTGSGVLHNSGHWLQHKREFIEWRKSSTSSILWLHGIRIVPYPSQTLRYSIIEFHKKNLPDEARSAPVAYFYLYQDRKEEAQDDGCDPLQLTTAECVEVILELLKDNPAVIFIDALDECDPVRRHELLEALDEIIECSENLVKVFVSSRDDNDIVCHLKNLPSVRISASDNGDDIIRFVHLEVEQAIHKKKLLGGNVSQRLRTKIIQVLVDGAQGMFRWVSLQIQNLCDFQRIKHERDLEQELGRLPKTLRASYDIIFKRILNSGKLSQRVATDAIRWLICAQRPLTVSEFLDALSQSSEGNRIVLSRDHLLDMCCNLVVLDMEFDIFRFAHLSVREYLEGRAEYSHVEAYLLAAERCLLEFVNNKETIESFRLNDSICFPPNPLFVACSFGLVSMLEILSTIEFVNWNQLNWNSCTGLQVGILHGHISVVRSLLQRNVDTNIKNGDQVTALSMAATTGNEDALELLLESDVDINSRDFSGKSALHFASEHGSVTVIQQLVYHGADPGAETRSGETPLFFAARHNHEAAVIYFLEKGVNTSVQTTSGETALFEASERGHEKIVRILLDSGAQIQARTTSGQTAIHRAAWMGHTRTVLILLEKYFKIFKAHDGVELSESVKVLEGATQPVLDTEIMVLIIEKLEPKALMFVLKEVGHYIPIMEKIAKAAAGSTRYGREAMTILFETQGEKVPITEEVVKAAAANTGSGKQVMKILFEQRGSSVPVTEDVFKAASMNMCHGKEIMAVIFEQQSPTDTPISEKISGWMLLHQSCANGNFRVVKFLVEHQAEVNMKTDDGFTPLYIASQNGHIEVVKFLVEHQAEVNTKTDDGSTPLYVASRNGYIEVVKFLVEHQAEVVKFLVEHQAEVNIKTDDGSTLLYIASQNGYIEVVKFLVEHQAEVNTKAGGGFTPLCVASENGHVEVVKFLVEHQAEVNMKIDGGFTPLYIASETGHIEVVKFLVEHQAEVDIKTDDATPLFIASRNGHIEVVKFLVEHQAEVNTKTDDGFTPLYIASQNGHIEVVKFLVEHQAEVNTKTDSDATPLYIASRNDHIEVVKFLVEHQAEVDIKVEANSRDSWGWTPLFWAAYNGHQTVAQLLLDTNKVDADLRDNRDRTPLSWAAKQGHEAVVQLLLNTDKVDADPRDKDGWTPLSWAADYGYEAVLQLLLNTNTVDVDSRDKDGRTPLSWAAGYGDEAVVQLLFNHGADIDVANTSGCTAL
ncbi:hypothetical protein BP6252_11457 [Coleophoma cylindrospora]|uniref:Uncharacterized protein n=1 Tax=Coleophoma cylindrospora TaxID=1849047 RepID=A0A3D8QKQ9_9HELO|nr:hypothetical protein BP6252_11457 [Coleophoma cylindrospora]